MYGDNANENIGATLLNKLGHTFLSKVSFTIVLKMN